MKIFKIKLKLNNRSVDYCAIKGDICLWIKITILSNLDDDNDDDDYDDDDDDDQ